MYRMIATITVMLLASVAHTATLEIPGPNSIQSGIGVISGWKCRVNGALTVRFDGGNAIPLLYGSERGDTRKPQGPCDDANTGFVAIMNWGNLSDGEHTAAVYDNGEEFDRAVFTVVTTGVQFLRDVTGSGTATLSNGQRATLVWSEASQAFVTTEFTDPPIEPEEIVTPEGGEEWSVRSVVQKTPEWVRACLDAGANPNVQDGRGETPLHEAAQYGNATVVGLLLDAGADPNVQDNYGGTPLLTAAQYGYATVVEMLLDAGADPNVQSPLRSVSVRNAAAAPVVKLLLDAGADPNAVQAGGLMQTLLHEATQHGNITITRLLLDAGADPNVQDRDGNTPLHGYVVNATIVEILLDSGADPNIQNVNGNTPLHWVFIRVAGGGDAITRLLLDAGADPNVRNNQGRAPLHWAQYGDATVVELLLDAGADPNVRDYFGNTPLHQAAQYGDATVVGLLLDAGANPNAQNNQGETPNCKHLDARCH